MRPIHPIHVIGTGGGPEYLTARLLQLIKESDVVFASMRLIPMFQGLGGSFKGLSPPFEKAFDEMEQLSHRGRVSVLVSGDPLFYSIGKLLVKRFGRENTVIHPNCTIAQVAFSRLKLPWDDAAIVSLHGRGMKALDEVLGQYLKIGLYTDPQNSPQRIAEFLLEREYECCDMCVLEDLGGKGERVRWFNISEALKETFREPNFVVLLFETDDVTACRRKIWFGMPEQCYTQEKLPITKREVRAVVLSRLDLTDIDLIMWDIGAGTGSISIEASRFIPLGQIYAVEKDPERVRMIRANLRRFSVRNVEIVENRAPECLSILPPPHRVFIGGSGGRIKEILRIAISRLQPGGKLIASCVILSNLGSICAEFERSGMEFEVLEIQVNRSRGIGDGLYLRAQNPVWLVIGEKRP